MPQPYRAEEIIFVDKNPIKNILVSIKVHKGPRLSILYLKERKNLGI